jgi:uncharacterized protein (DUF2342 family)
MVTPEASDQAWVELLHEPEEVRETKMVARYTELAALSADERLARMLAMARAEYALPDDELRTFTLSRIRAWLRLEPETARTTASTYDAAMQRMPGTAAMRRVAIVQTLARELPAEDEERLRELVPGVFAGQPHAVAVRRAHEPSPAPPPAPPAPAVKKPWWKFWQR